jgi:hypothetical protein
VAAVALCAAGWLNCTVSATAAGSQEAEGEGVAATEALTLALAVRVTLALSEGERVGEPVAVTLLEALRDGVPEMLAVRVALGETDALGVAVEEGAMQQAGSTTLHCVSFSRPAAVLCTQLALPPVLAGAPGAHSAACAAGEIR